MNRQEFDDKRQVLENKILSAVTMEEFREIQQELNTLVDEFVSAKKRCTKDKDHEMATLVATWG